jgi:murein peptide amidase A
VRAAHRRPVPLVCVLLTLSACASSARGTQLRSARTDATTSTIAVAADDTTTTPTVTGTLPPTVAPVSTAPSTTATTALPATAAPTTVARVTHAPTAAPATSGTTNAATAGIKKTYSIGTSVQGRPITVVERGTPGGKVVMVVGVIHGDEDAGVAIVDQLASSPVPAGIHLYLVRSMNPDGQAAQTRTNAHQVDLNRNFPLQWAPLGQPGDWQYAGTGPASEPETQAMVAFIAKIKPKLAVWYHQDLNRIAPRTGSDGEVIKKYASLTGMPIKDVTGGTYTGTATPWEQSSVPGSLAFIVELGPTLSGRQAATHAGAVEAIAT